MPARRPRRPSVTARAALAATAASAAALLTAGCGNDRTLPPDVTTPGPPLGSNAERFDAAGLRFQSPAGWNLAAGTPPLVTSVSTGRATVTIFRYPRTEPLPRTRAELGEALDALADAAKQRDPTFEELGRRRLEVDGRPAVVLRGTQTVAGQPRTVRSTHVYAFRAELVIDAMAPPGDFVRVDREAFRPLVRSVKLRRPRG